MTGISRRPGIALAAMVLAVAVSAHAAEEVLLFDDFAKDGPLDIQGVWQAGEKAPHCSGSSVCTSPTTGGFYSRRQFSEAISVEFKGVRLGNPKARSGNNNLGLTTSGYPDDIIFFRFWRGGRFAVRKLDKKGYASPGKRNDNGTALGPVGIEPEGTQSVAYDLRMDWWPGKLVRYYVNGALVAEYTDHVMAGSSPVGVRDEKAYFRIGSIKVTRIPESAEEILREVTETQKKALAARDRMIAEYHRARKATRLPAPREVTDDPKNPEFNKGKVVEASSIGALFDAIGFAPDGKNRFFFVHLTDTHIFVGTPPEIKSFGDTAEFLPICLKEINAMRPRPAFVVHTGDMVCYSSVPEFQRFKELMKTLNPEIKSFYILGNHDVAVSNYKEIFPDRPIDYSFDWGMWHFVALFTQGNGSITEDQYFQLKKDLGENRERPTMLFHHHPLLMGWPKENVRPLREKIFHLVKAYRNVRYAFSGHWHMNFLAQCRYEGLPPVNLVTSASPTIRWGGIKPGYRMVCVDGDKVHATIFRKVGERKFRVDPPPEEWYVYFPPPLDYHTYIGLLDPEKPQ